MPVKLPAVESATRLKRFCNIMDIEHESWRHVFIFDPILCYYFTGTMQNGVLYIPSGEIPTYFIMRDYEKAMGEVRFVEVVEIATLYDITEKIFINPNTLVYVDKERVSASFLDRFADIVGLNNIVSCDKQLNKCRFSKSPYEINLIKSAGDILSIVLDNFVPQVLDIGITEHDLSLAVNNELLKQGADGVVRCADLSAEMVQTYVSFGMNTTKRLRGGNTFGAVGLSAATPHYGSTERVLKESEVINIEAICSVSGYHARASRMYSVGDLPNYAKMQYTRCYNIMNRLADLLVPNKIASEVYKTMRKELHPELEGVFMGKLGNETDYVGQSTGLFMDDVPKISLTSHTQISDNSVFVLEPRVYVEKVGLIGVSNTFHVTSKGGATLTGVGNDIIII